MNKRLFSFCLVCGILGISVQLFGQKKSMRDVTYIIAADLHFDELPESDQYYHVVTMNRVPGYFVMQSGDTIKRVDGVVLAGDLFDRSRPEILDLFRARYECGLEEKQIHFPVYPGLGNHDLDIVADAEKPNTEEHLALVKNYMDSLLQMKLRKGEILNLHTSSLSYSWNVGDVHFVHSQRYAGDTSYCESNMKWLREDLERYAANGNPVVFIQHYGVDDWAIRWWPQSCRNELFDILDDYHVVAFFAGHTHSPLLKFYRGYPIYEVNNAWPDRDGNGSFAVLRICDNHLEIASCRWLDGEGNFELSGPCLDRTLSRPKDKKVLVNAFSHNDYWRENPLEDALSFRFNAVEADLWLIDGEVYVGHERPNPDSSYTFHDLYIKPLIDRIKHNEGRVYPCCDRPFLLMTDFKRDGEKIYEILKKQLEPYKKYFCRLEEGKYIEGPILFFISGNRPLNTLPLEKNRMAFLDGQIKDLGKQIPMTLSPVISDDYNQFFSWNGHGSIPIEQYERMKDIINQVHQENKLFRWWGAPETIEAKKLFVELGVDLIGTDNLNMLYNLLDNASFNK